MSYIAGPWSDSPSYTTQIHSFNMKDITENDQISCPNTIHKFDSRCNAKL